MFHKANTNTRFDVTWHAVDRYAQRCGVPIRDAQKRLVDSLMSTGTPLKEKTCNGDLQWAIKDPDCVVVVKREGRRLVVVTVLPPANPVELEDDLGEHAVVYSPEVPWDTMLHLRFGALQEREKTERQRLDNNNKAHARETKVRAHSLTLLESRVNHFLFSLLMSVAPDLEDAVIKELGFRPRPYKEPTP